MRIESIDIVEVKVPARAGAVNSPALDKPLHKMVSGDRPAWTLQFDELPKHIVIARCDNGVVGLGEALRDADPAVLAGMARSLIGVDVARLAWQQLPLAKTREYDAFEILVLDLLGKQAGLPVSALLGGALRDRVLVGAWAGHRTPEDAAEIARAAVGRGMSHLKLKCDRTDDVVAVAAAVREACGPAIKLVFDPNERFGELRHAVEVARGLERVGNVLCLEDPLPRWDLRSYAELRRRTAIPIAVHVALGYTELGQRIEDVALAFREEAADVFNFSSGIADFLRMAHVADLAHRPYWHGSEVDLGIMEAANTHAVAAAAGCVLPSDLFGRMIREHDLLVEPLAIEGGGLLVPDGPGLGVELDRSALSRYETDRVVVEA